MGNNLVLNFRVKEEYSRVRLQKVGFALQRYCNRFSFAHLLNLKQFQTIFDGVFEKQTLFHFEQFNCESGISALEVFSCLYILCDVLRIPIEQKLDALIALVQFKAVPELVVNDFCYNKPDNVVLIDQVQLMLECAVVGLTRLATGKNNFPANEVIKAVADQIFTTELDSVSKLSWVHVKEKLLLSRPIFLFLNQFIPVVHVPTVISTLNSRMFEFETKSTLLLDSKSIPASANFTMSDFSHAMSTTITVEESEKGGEALFDGSNVPVTNEAWPEVIIVEDAPVLRSLIDKVDVTDRLNASAIMPTEELPRVSPTAGASRVTETTPAPPVSLPRPSSKVSSRPHSRTVTISQSRPDSASVAIAATGYQDQQHIGLAPSYYSTDLPRQMPNKTQRQKCIDLLTFIANLTSSHRLDYKELTVMSPFIDQVVDENNRPLLLYMARSICGFNLICAATTHENYILLCQLLPLIRLASNIDDQSSHNFSLEVDATCSEVNRFLTLRLEEFDFRAMKAPMVRPVSSTVSHDAGYSLHNTQGGTPTAGLFANMIPRIAWIEIRLLQHIQAFHLVSTENVEENDGRQNPVLASNKLVIFWNELISKSGPTELVYPAEILRFLRASCGYKILRSQRYGSKLGKISQLGSIADGCQLFNSFPYVEGSSEIIETHLHYAVEEFVRVCMKSGNNSKAVADSQVISTRSCNVIKAPQTYANLFGSGSKPESTNGISQEMMRQNRSTMDTIVSSLVVYVANFI